MTTIHTISRRLMIRRLATFLSLIVFFIVSIPTANGQTDRRQPKFPIGKKFVPEDPRDKDLRLPILGKVKNGPDDDSKKGGQPGSAAAIDDGFDPPESGRKAAGGKGTIRISRSSKGGQSAPVIVDKPPRLPIVTVDKDFELPPNPTRRPARRSQSNSDN